jgi:hypothetical protein
VDDIADPTTLTGQTGNSPPPYTPSTHEPSSAAAAGAALAVAVSIATTATRAATSDRPPRLRTLYSLTNGPAASFTMMRSALTAVVDTASALGWSMAATHSRAAGGVLPDST